MKATFKIFFAAFLLVIFVPFIAHGLRSVMDKHIRIKRPGGTVLIIPGRWIMGAGGISADEYIVSACLDITASQQLARAGS